MATAPISDPLALPTLFKGRIASPRVPAGRPAAGDIGKPVDFAEAIARADLCRLDGRILVLLSEKYRGIFLSPKEPDWHEIKCAYHEWVERKEYTVAHPGAADNAGFAAFAYRPVPARSER